ncbi:KIR protein [Plasmodium coatneyi]|uniref:KIR protein n=1 Tax=Plasmodium coatneyi TaxID=208452 RepID=A0A1B1DX14_9APIC|nr:KIR protein [Plasmodium coatneyi]ANQ07169.1 KIR protein [Plasmodium coatneyi]
MIMKAIYRALQQSHFWNGCTNQCTNLYGGLNKDRFPQAKVLFDWYYNYTTILRNKEQNCRNYCTGNKCNTAYNTAHSTYTTLGRTCGSSGGESYCTDFKENPKEKPEYNPPQSLDCPAAPAPQDADTSTLPSQKIYNALDQGVGTSCILKGSKGNSSQLEVQLKGSLSPYGGDNWTWINKIIRNYCYACEGRGMGDSLSDSERFGFFYYWLGDKINKEQIKGRGSLSMVMGPIYGHLQNSISGCTCNNIYPNINKERFERAKTLFDWYYNYSKLQNSDECSKYCTENKCQQSFTATQKAYSQLSKDCPGTGNDKYCDKFKANYKKDGEYGQPKQLTCRTSPAQPTESLIRSDSNTGDEPLRSESQENGAILAGPPLLQPSVEPTQPTPQAAVSHPEGSSREEGGQGESSSSRGSAAAAAAPATLRGSTRKKRSTRSNFNNTLTEDSSTVASTLHSEESTIADSTHGSTIYNNDRSPSNSRRGTNTNRRQRQQNRNIGYQNM